MNGFEFIVVQDVYKETYDKDDNPSVVLSKENLKTKWYCRDLSMITEFEQAINADGNIRMHHTKVVANGIERIIRMPYKKAKELLTTPAPLAPGFKIHKK